MKDNHKYKFKNIYAKTTTRQNVPFQFKCIHIWNRVQMLRGRIQFISSEQYYSNHLTLVNTKPVSSHIS